MITLRKPKVETIYEFLSARAEEEFTYSHVGATATAPPPDYIVDHRRVSLGQGDEVFEDAKQALIDWKQFGMMWVEALPPHTPIREGQTLAIVATRLGMWFTNPCRIVYVVDENDGDRRRFGFAYGTLPGHVGTGEERFLIEMEDDGTVYYDLYAFSQPHTILARLGYPYMRMNQKKFGRESVAAMQRAVAESVKSTETTTEYAATKWS